MDLIVKALNLFINAVGVVYFIFCIVRVILIKYKKFDKSSITIEEFSLFSEINPNYLFVGGGDTSFLGVLYPDRPSNGEYVQECKYIFLKVKPNEVIRKVCIKVLDVNSVNSEVLKKEHYTVMRKYRMIDNYICLWGEMGWSFSNYQVKWSDKYGVHVFENVIGKSNMIHHNFREIILYVFGLKI